MKRQLINDLPVILGYAVVAFIVWYPIIVLMRAY